MSKPRGTYTPGRHERYKTGRHPARCNKRGCQARRNLSKHPALYVRWPTCHVAGCEGRMYVDWTRKAKAPSDHPPVCDDPLCRYTPPLDKNGRPLPKHTVSTKGCNGYEDWLIESTVANSKHSPRRAEDGEEAPF